MKKDNLKRIIKQFETLIEELKSEVYSDKESYVHPWDEHMKNTPRIIKSEDDDGYADLFNSVPDAVASIANYLKKHGWKREGSIVKRVELNKVSKTYKHQNNLDKYIPLRFTEGIEEKYIVEEGDSLLSIAISHDLELKQLMSLNSIKDKNLIKIGQTILLNKPKDLYFIGDDNFIAITKYNRSHFYAKAVYDLSTKFK